MGLAISDCCDLSSEHLLGGKGPPQNHMSAGLMTNLNCSATGHQSLDWQYHQRDCNSSANPWRELSMVHNFF